MIGLLENLRIKHFYMYAEYYNGIARYEDELCLYKSASTTKVGVFGCHTSTLITLKNQPRLTFENTGIAYHSTRIIIVRPWL
jgi:hypothetical protein